MRGTNPPDEMVGEGGRKRCKFGGAQRIGGTLLTVGASAPWRPQLCQEHAMRAFGTCHPRDDYGNALHLPNTQTAHEAPNAMVPPSQ